MPDASASSSYGAGGGGSAAIPSAVLWAMRQRPRQPNARLVLLAIADIVGMARDGVQIDVGALENSTGLKADALRRNVSALEAAGLVMVKRRAGRASIYALPAEASA